VPHRFLFVAFALLAALAGRSAAQSADEALITRMTAERHGLKRAWFAQIELDPASEQVSYINQHGGTLFVQTSHAMVHALDAETGRTLWAEQVGRRGLLSLATGANDKNVGVINGTTLYVVDRRNGRLLWERSVGGVPGAGAALSDTHAFVPMVNGVIEGYELDNPIARPWFYQSYGRILIQPMITPKTVSWTTNRGHFVVVDSEKLTVRLRLETGDSIESRPAYWTPYLYATSLDGFVYAIDEDTGETAWKFAAGDPISQPPVAIKGVVFAASDTRGLHQLDGKSGSENWFAPSIIQFLSASPTRVYACSRYLDLAILDIKTGALIDTLPMGPMSFRLINRQTDRIYLCTRTGRLECLHEIGLNTAIVYKPPAPKLTEKPAEKSATAAPADEKKKPAAKKPADEDAADAEAAEEPADKKAPAEGAEADENPFK